MKTYSPRPRDIERRWYVIDASGAVLGRLATEAASILRGKHKPIFAPHMDTGDHVIVVNAKGVQITGGKGETKVAYRHSGYPGGLTETKYARLLEEKPAFAVEKAIRGMLPKNRLGRAMFRKLQVYAGPEHPHQAQQPEVLRLGEIPKWTGLPQVTLTPDRGEKAAPGSAEPARKRSTAKRATTAKPAAKSTAKKSTAKRSTAKSAATRTAAKASTAKTTAKKTTAKPAAKSTARRTIARRKKKEE
jgi:large subunit ribosomal protein L13